MRNNLLKFISLMVLGCAAYAQEFEVATVKPAVQSNDGRISIVMGGGPGTDDPGRINYENVNLRMVLTRAYGIKTYQLSGPAWLDSERYTITAKIPAGATKEQFLTMLQNLVADRFKMTSHREKRELPAYALVVTKGGMKMKESVEEAPDKAPAAAPSGPSAAPNRTFQMGKDGFPPPPPGMGRGGVRMMMMPGRMKLEASGMTIQRLAETLEQQLDRAVIDATELTGKYDFTLTFEPDQSSKMMAGLNRGFPGPGGPGGGGDGHVNAPDGDAAPSVFTAVQEQLGLKLDPRKTAVDMVVIDHLEKAPTEN